MNVRLTSTDTYLKMHRRNFLEIVHMSRATKGSPEAELSYLRRMLKIVSKHKPIKQEQLRITMYALSVFGFYEGVEVTNQEIADALGSSASNVSTVLTELSKAKPSLMKVARNGRNKARRFRKFPKVVDFEWGKKKKS